MVRVDGRLVLNTSALILNAALAGFGLTYLIELQVQKHLDSGELGRVLVNWCPPYSAVHPVFVALRDIAFQCNRRITYVTFLTASTWLSEINFDQGNKSADCPSSG